MINRSGAPTSCRKQRESMPIRKTVIVLIFFILMLALNIIRLVRAARFRKALKDKKVLKVTVNIASVHGIVGRNYFTTRYASAKYNIDGKSVVGRMICSYLDGKLQKGQNAEVLVNGSFPKMFAFSEKQIRHAFAEYLIYVIVASAAVAVLGFVLFIELSHYI